MTNSRLTNEALRLLADRRVRQAGAMFWAMLVLSAALVWRAATDNTPIAWFCGGIVIGATLGAAGNLITIVGHARAIHDDLEQAREAAETIAGFVSDELHRRGDGYEAVLEPSGLITIHQRDRREPRPRMH